MCTALGNSVEIPFIIRRLADTLYKQAPNGLPVTFDPDFIVSLDGGSGPDDLSAAVASYHGQWWTGPLPPPADSLLNMSMLEACLQHHRKVSGIKRFYRSGLLKTSYTWPRYVMDSPAAPPTCDSGRCLVYRGVALSIEQSYKELLNQAETLASFSEANADRFGRRAAIAYQLYEAAAAQDIPPPPRKMIPKSSLSRQTTKARSQNVVATAVVDLKRLQNTPEVKWQWGPSLSRHEVLQAVKPPVKESRNHSGYNISLRDDQQGSDSDGPSSIHSGSSAVFSPIGKDIMEIPDLMPKHYNHHFNFPPLRHDYSTPADTPAGPAADSPSFHIPPPRPAAFVAVSHKFRAPDDALSAFQGRCDS
jgi:hypothetical protein